MSTGSADEGRPRVARAPDLEERIIEHVAGDPGISRRKSAADFPVVICPIGKDYTNNCFSLSI
jgi:hypothetical protein